MMQPLVRRTWAPRADTPTLHASYNRARWTVIGALTLSPTGRRLGFYFLGQDHNATGLDFVEFVRLLTRRIHRPLLVIWDGLPAHRTAARLLAGDPRFHFEFLPGYAPELNPVEWAWSWCKYGRLANHCPDSFDDLREAIVDNLRELRRSDTHLRSFFEGSRLAVA